MDLTSITISMALFALGVLVGLFDSRLPKGKIIKAKHFLRQLVAARP